MNESKFHSVRLDKDKCRGCTNCLKRCPTEAIRIRGGRAHIINERCIPQGEPVELDDRQKQYRDGMQPDGKGIDGFYTSGGNTARIGRMEYQVSENFNQWILYNRGGDQGFISIEPQCGAVNCLNSGRGLHRLAAGETETFRTVIRIAE